MGVVLQLQELWRVSPELLLEPPGPNGFFQGLLVLPGGVVFPGLREPSGWTPPSPGAMPTGTQLKSMQRLLVGQSESFSHCLGSGSHLKFLQRLPEGQ